MCGLPGGYPDDLIDVDLDALEEPGGDGVIRVDQRRLPGPPAAADARPRRPRSSSRCAPCAAAPPTETREIVDRALGQARGGRGARLGRRRRSTRATTPGGPDLVPPRGRAAAGRVDQRPAGASSPTTCRRATSSPSGSSTRAASSRAHGFTYLDAWCHSAEAPRLFRLDRIAEARSSTARSQTEPEPPRDLARRASSQRSPETHPGRPSSSSPPARWVVEYYPVQAVRRRRGGAARGRPAWSPTSAGCSGCCSGWPRTPGCSRPPEYADVVHSRRTGRPQPLPVTPAYYRGAARQRNQQMRSRCSTP